MGKPPQQSFEPLPREEFRSVIIKVKDEICIRACMQVNFKCEKTKSPKSANSPRRRVIALLHSRRPCAAANPLPMPLLDGQNSGLGLNLSGVMPAY